MANKLLVESLLLLPLLKLTEQFLCFCSDCGDDGDCSDFNSFLLNFTCTM